ncbi:MAG: hypothetical protein HOP30_11210 [Cyclobacteriaceae bacterium]|nr:hypothetical protein [Cyclobacteriaceae bacterium]
MIFILLEGKMYVKWGAAIEAGISKSTLDVAKNRKSNSWGFTDDPEDKRRVLIDFEKLKDEYKDKIKAKFGDPYEYVAKEPIRQMIVRDLEAEKFYMAYQYESAQGKRSLPETHVEKYTVAASVLNLLKKLDKREVKEKLNIPLEKFYKHLCELIEADNISLPTNYRKLLAGKESALAKYNALGYASLIDWRFGNQLAAKVADEVSESLLKEIIAKSNQYDDVLVAMQYNVWAKQQGKDTIHHSTVGVWRRKYASDLDMFRNGNASTKNTFLPQVKGYRPTQPLYLVENDDNHLDLLFLEPGNKSPRKYISIVVADSFNDYPLGKSYALNGSLSDGQSIALVKAAYVDAMYHIRELTGAWHLPHETKSDRWAIKSLEPFYKKMGNWVAPGLGNKNRGYIEQFFGSPHWKRCIKLGANNYSGNNMTAKHRGVNMEEFDRNVKNRRLIGNEAVEQIENFFHRLRSMPQTNGISKQEQWLEAFNAMPSTERKQITDEQFLITFGIEHQPKNGELPRISNRGLECQINGQRFSFDIVGGTPIHEIGKQVHVLYDPYDMSRVMLTDYKGLRMMAREARLQPRALKDAHRDSRTYLNAVLSEKLDAVKKISAKAERRQEVLNEHFFDVEAVLQAGVMVKEIKQYAEQKVLANGSYEEDDFEQM